MGNERAYSRGVKAIEHFIFQCISFKQERLRKGDKDRGERQFFNRL